MINSTALVRTLALRSVVTGTLGLALVLGGVAAGGAQARDDEPGTRNFGPASVANPAPLWGAATISRPPASGTTYAFVNGSADGPGDDVTVAGILEGAVYLSSGPSSDDSIALANDSRGAFVAGFDTSRGVYSWAQRIATGGAWAQPRVVVTPDDTVVVIGQFSGTAHFPSGPSADDSLTLVALGSPDLFVAALDPSTSHFMWATQVGGPGAGTAVYQPDVVMASDRTAMVISSFTNDIYFPNGPNADDSFGLTFVGPYSDIFVSEIDLVDGEFRWALSSSALGFDSSHAADMVDDTVAVGGGFKGTASFPSGPGADDSIILTSQSTSFWDTYYGVISGDDTYYSWVQQLKSTPSGFVRLHDMEATTTGRIILSGYYWDRLYLPTGPAPDDSIVFEGTAGVDRGFLAVTNADDSYIDWAVDLGGASINGITVTSDDTIVVGGLAGSPYSFPSGPGADDSIVLTGWGAGIAFLGTVTADDSAFSWVQRAGGPPGAYMDRAYAVSSADDTLVLIGNTTAANREYYFPSGPLADDSIAVASGSSTNMFFAGVLGAVSGAGSSPSPSPVPSPSPPPADPTPAYPPSPPPMITAEAGDGSATVTWSAPVASGSFPITNYQVRSVPTGGSCLTPSLSCEIKGLVNGTAHTFQVRALNGAGWGPWSVPSEAVTPGATQQPPETDDPSIVITGTRGQVAGKPGVVVSGASTGMGGNQVLRPWIRFPGQSSYSEGSASVPVDTEGAFTWSRRTGKRIYVYFATEDGSVKSNRLVIRR